MTRRRSVFAALAAATAWMAGPAAQQAPRIPLCPGMTIVTAVSSVNGDYESIKTIESMDASTVRLKYSTERTVQDIFSNQPPTLQKITMYRSVRRVDLEKATLYQQQFSTELPELIPDTTAIGTSSAVLNALKTKGQSPFGIFIAYSQIKPPIDRGVHPNVYDNQMVSKITRVGTGQVMVPVIVNDALVSLPAIQAAGDFFGDKSEFLFLDDPANPLTLKFRYGVDAYKNVPPPPGAPPRPSPDKDVLQVIKITDHCPVTAAAPAAAVSELEQALAQTGRADVYSLYFSFNSDTVRDESEPTLKEIADVLKRHPDWKLAVNGHTDGIGTDAANLDLSKRRAAAVKDALVKRYGISAARLSTAGFGKSRPKDTNDTLEGRARNRRVELVRS